MEDILISDKLIKLINLFRNLEMTIYQFIQPSSYINQEAEFNN